MKVNKFGISAVAVTLAAALLWYAARPPSIEDAGRRVIGCIMSKDSDCLWEYMGTLERDKVVVDKNDLSRILKEYLAPELAKLEATNKSGVDLNEAFEQGHSYAEFRRSDGERIPLGITLYESDGRIVAPYLVTEIVMFVQLSRYFKKMPGERNGLSVAKAWKEGSEKDSHILSELGMMGIVQQSKNVFLDWQANLQHQRQRVEKIKAELSKLQAKGA